MQRVVERGLFLLYNPAAYIQVCDGHTNGKDIAPLEDNNAQFTPTGPILIARISSCLAPKAYRRILEWS